MSELRIITEPTVRIISKQMFVSGETEAYLDEHFPQRNMLDGASTDTSNGAEAVVEFAGRNCYLSYKSPRPGGNKAYIDNLLASGHGSCLEHAVWTFLIYGVSRSLSHELIRHRAGVAISELSQRFVDMSDIGFVVPPALLPHHAAWREWQVVGGDATKQQLADAQDFEMWMERRERDLEEYAELAWKLERDAPADLPATDKRKWARQAARSVLPECTETRLVWTANARTLRHVIEMRCSPHADAEIRRLFTLILSLMKVESPHLFGDYDEVGKTEWRKV